MDETEKTHGKDSEEGKKIDEEVDECTVETRQIADRVIGGSEAARWKALETVSYKPA